MTRCLYLSHILCSDRVQLHASGAQLSLHLLHVVAMGGRELPDPPVLLHRVLMINIWRLNCFNISAHGRVTKKLILFYMF